MMRDLIITNVNRCVENLSKILSETCSNPSEELPTMADSSSINNNNQQTSSRMRRAFYEGIQSRSVQVNLLSNRSIDPLPIDIEKDLKKRDVTSLHCFFSYSEIKTKGKASKDYRMELFCIEVHPSVWPWVNL